MKLALVGVAFGGVIGLTLLSSFAGNKVGARGVWDGGKLVEGKCIEVSPPPPPVKVCALCEWRAVR